MIWAQALLPKAKGRSRKKHIPHFFLRRPNHSTYGKKINKKKPLGFVLYIDYVISLSLPPRKG
ncbi:MAG: hypothetical protein A2Z72_01500 [Omnitrophica bacterium RBG_13_46_9]|nr:MAG: hypothetical protein A2Z72_01500 [Omnitrophica bacterium RBG_13_46_9]